MTKQQFIGWIVMILLLIIYVMSSNKHNDRKGLNYHIEGKIKEVKYNMKSRPTIIVNSTRLSMFPFNLRRQDSLAVGDSIYKERGLPFLNHYKKNESSGQYELYKRHDLNN